MKVRCQILSTTVACRVAALCAAVFVASAHPARAGINVWTSHGPGTASISSLAVDPTTPGTLYVSTGGLYKAQHVSDSVFKSTDDGRTWSAASAGLPDPVVVWALAVDPTTMPSRLYAGTGAGLFRSTNAGRTWSAASTGRVLSSATRPTPGPPSPSGAVTALAVDPTIPGTLYAAFDTGIFKSTDAGNTWINPSTGLPGGPTVFALALDPRTPGTLYAGTGDGVVFKSVDGGSTWNAASTTGLSGAIVSSFAFDPSTPGTLFVGMGGGVFKTIDGGDTWTATPVRDIVFALARDPTSPPGTLYAGTAGGINSITGSGGGVLKSTDGGATWSAANTGLPDFATVTALALDPRALGKLYATSGGGGADVTGGGVFKSINFGDTWSAASTGLPGGTIVSALGIDPTMPGTVYAGTDNLNGSGDGGSGVFKSMDGGNTWSAASTGLPGNGNTSVVAFAFDPTTPGTLYAGTYRGVFTSTDGGGTWSGTGLSDRVFALVVDPHPPRTLYAVTSNGSAVFKSIDGGRTWSDTGPPDSPNVTALAVDPTTPGTLYAGTTPTFCGEDCSNPVLVFKTTNGGATWSAASTGLPGGITALAIDPATPTTLYAGITVCGGESCGGEVDKSTDGGATWSDASTGLANSPVVALIPDPTAPGTLYAGRYYGGVFKSTDGADSWVALDHAGLINTAVSTLALDPSNSGTLYAGTFGGGVFDIEQGVSSCVGDCRGTATVAISDLITLVNMALGDTQAACPNGVPSGTEVTVALIIQAVNNALSGCAATV